MKKVLIFSALFLLASVSLSAQVVKGAGLWYFNGLPNVTPSVATGTEVAYSINNKSLFKWNRTTSAWVAVVQDSSITNELQDLILSNDTLSLTLSDSIVLMAQYRNHVWEITNLSDTTSITGDIEGDIAYTSTGDTIAFRGASAWLPFTGGGGGGTFNSFNIAGDTGSDIVTDGQTVTVAGGYGINTAETGGTVTVTADTTHLATQSDISGFVRDSTAVRVSDVANVQIYGALGNGSDATTAFQNAIASGKTVYVPHGRYLITTALTLQEGQTIYGDGDNSVVAVTANISVFRLTKRNSVQNFRIVGDKGGGDTAQYGIFGDGGSAFDTVLDNRITSMFLDSLGGAGIYLTRIVGNHEGTLISDCVIKGNNYGIHLAVRGEYTKLTGCSVSLNTIGIQITGGNTNVSSCIISDNTTGVSVSNGDNSDHGVVSGCSINHNSTAVTVGGITLGMSFFGNQIWQNTTAFNLSGCSNVMVVGGTISNGTISATSALNCFFTNIQFYSMPTLAIGSSGVFFINNFQGTGVGVFPTTIPGDYVLRTNGVNTHTYVPVELPIQTVTSIQLDGTDVVTTTKNNKIFQLLADSVTTSNLSFAGGVIGEYLLHITGVTDSLTLQFASPPNGPSGGLMDSVVVYYDGFYRMYYDEINYTINIPGNEYELPFDPSSIAGLKLWLDASDAATITTATGGVSVWADKSASNNDFSQSFSGARPDVVAAGKNGLDVIDFNNELLELTATTNRDSFRFLHNASATFFIVVKPSTSANPEANYDFFGNKAIGGTGRGYLLGYADAGALEDRFLGQISDGTNTVVLNYDNNKITPNDFNILIYSTDVAAATALRGLYYVDAGAVNATNASTVTASSSDAANNIFIGANGAQANVMAGGQICEILIYNSVLSTTNRELVRDYLNTKWAVY